MIVAPFLSSIMCLSSSWSGQAVAYIWGSTQRGGMICTPPPADSGCPMSGYARLRDLWVNPPPSPPKKTHPLQCFLNQTAADPRRVMSHPRGRGTGAAGSRAGSDAMPLGRAPNTHVNTVHVPPCVSTSQIPPPPPGVTQLWLVFVFLHTDSNLTSHVFCGHFTHWECAQPRAFPASCVDSHDRLQHH